MKNNIGKFKDFDVLDFPENVSAIYIIFFIKNSREFPLYVGETGRLQGRIGDYISANFKASTDFKVGEAIKYLQKKDYKIIIKCKSLESPGERQKEQNKIIRYFQDSGRRLLNESIGYDYRTANEDEERKRIKKFCDNILTEKIK